MSRHLGDFDTSAVIYGKFSTFRPSTGASFTLAGSPVLSVYKDNSATQSTSGVTLTADFDSVTGLNHFAVDTSSDGTFYSAGSFFSVVITTGTIDSVSVTGAVVAEFTIRKNSALKPVTAGRAVVVDASGLVDANTVKVGPSGSGTAQTARDVGASVLLSPGTGTGQLSITSGVVDANATKIGGTSQTGRDIGASVLLSSGTGTGQVSLSSGAVLVQGLVKKGAAFTGFVFSVVGSDGLPTSATDAEVQVRTGTGSYAPITASVTPLGGGDFGTDFTTGETNANCMTLLITSTSGAFPAQKLNIITVP